MSTEAQINNLLLNGKVAAAAACVREKLKGGHNHLEETEIGTRIAERDSKSVSELELERSPPGLLDAMTQRLLGQTDASTATLLRRVLALAAEEKAVADPELRVQMRERAKAMQYGTMRRDYLAAVRDGREPGDEIALELLAALLHLHVRLLREDGSEEREIKCAGPPLAELHLLPAGDTFCTLVVPDFKGVEQAAPADGVPEPPPAWVPPAVGERVDVDVEDDGWCSAKVLAVLADGQFKVQVSVAPSNCDSSVTPSGMASPRPSLSMDDWLTWEDEGKDWRRRTDAPLPLATDSVAAPAAITSPDAAPTSPATTDASDETVSSPPTRPIDPHAGSGGEDHPIRAGRAIAAAAAINSGGGGDATSDGGGGVGGGGLKKRPRGRSPAGKTWNDAMGEWEGTDEARAEAQAEGAQAVAAQAAAQAEGGGDDVTDLSQLRGAVDALTERMLAPVLEASADAPVDSEATELSLKWPEQPTKMVALLAQCSALGAEGVEVDAETEVCIEMCDDKKGALHARTDKLELEEVQAEEALQKLEGCNESLQQAGCDTNEVRAKLSAAINSLEQLQRERVACGEALTVVQLLPEQLQQQVPVRPTPALPPALATATTSASTSQSPPTPLAGVARAPGAQRGGSGSVQGAAELR